ncbi:bifunctional DNA primase/polymerase [Streptomyces abikoensis]|uniref:bifunctional DNA primase/polymerase n=1 Tax=Streptomyces abikoensis TaxID=97398 RepID=UPI00340B337C
MSSRPYDPRPARHRPTPVPSPAPTPAPAPSASWAPPAPAYVTLAGADWLASAGRAPHEIHALWADDPMAPVVLPCGTVFDVIDAPALFGRRILARLWSPGGPGSGPVAAHRGRLLLFAAPGTAQRLPALLAWEEWGRRDRTAPPLLCYGTGDAVTVPPLYPSPEGSEPTPAVARWLIAPEVRRPRLPGADALLWACVRAARAMTLPITTGG